MTRDDELEDALRTLGRELPVWDHAEQFAKFQARRGPAQGTRWPRHMWLVYGLAASLVIGLGTLTLGRAWSHDGTSAREYATVAGQRLNVTLGDGSRLVLAPESRVRVGASGREVRLDGEAYFAVVHDERHPFSVLSRNIKITDIGTEFDVRAYDADVRVAVAKGEVSLRSQPPLPLTPSPVAFGAGRGNFINDVREGGSEKRAPSAPVSATRPYDGNDTTYLTAGDVAEATETGFTVTHHTDIASATAWLQGGLAFHNTPLADAVHDIARTYDITIEIADSALGARPITATFVHESVNDVLDEITDVLGARYERIGQRVVIRQRAGDARHEPNAELHAHVPLQTARTNK